jgi:hypothetical protein
MKHDLGVSFSTELGEKKETAHHKTVKTASQLLNMTEPLNVHQTVLLKK